MVVSLYAPLALLFLLGHPTCVYSFQLTKKDQSLHKSSTRLFSSAGPRGEARRRQRRSPTTRLRPTEKAVFDGKALATEQNPNHDAPPLDLSNCNTLKCVTDDMDDSSSSPLVQQPAFTFLSLDSLFEHDYGFSHLFNADADFRNAIRDSMREDIYDSTPQYQDLAAKAKEMLLLPDSSLQGSWHQPANLPNDEIRMKRLTTVLQQGLGTTEITGDDLMQALGNLCGPEPCTHWIDIVGVQDRVVPHSWHQDTGRSVTLASKTVLWGFPKDNDYQGCGVFSHVVSLLHESHVPPNSHHLRMQPVLFDGSVDPKHIVAPFYGPGRELLVYRDVDVLHSSPNVAYRTSVMRFM